MTAIGPFSKTQSFFMTDLL